MTMNDLFGPLNRKYCVWFYFLSIIGFVFIVLLLISSIYIGVTKKMGAAFYVQTLISLGYGAILYFQNRLLYSMCSSSI
jgi:hypothetical protein